MSLHKLPLFVWVIFVTAILLLFSLPLFFFVLINSNYIFIVIFTSLYLYTINLVKIRNSNYLPVYDYILIFIIILHFTSILSNFLSSEMYYYFSEKDLNTIVLHVGESGESLNTKTVSSPEVNRTVQDVYNHGSWPDTVRTIFIYGTGMLRYMASKIPTGKAVTITSTIATDYGSQMAKRAFEDPSWLREHMKTWKLIKKDKPEELHMEAGDDKEAINIITANSTENTNSYLPYDSLTLFEGFDFNLNEIVPFFIHVFKLEPVSVNYSQTLLAEQHQMLALALFILSISAIFLFLSFVFNVIVFSFRDKFKSYFKNKYILSYLNLSFKFIVLDLSFLFMVLIYNFYYIVSIAHFLITHPINPN